MYKRLGNFINLVDKKNEDQSVIRLRGVSTTKQLIESVTSIEDVDISKYKVVENGQFVYSADTSRRGDKIALAFNDKEDCIVSSIYKVFEVSDKNKLLPEFLFLFFNREEFDRYARFNSWGSARETFDWEDMCDTKIPMLSIDDQKKYVDIYQGIKRNKKVYKASLDDLQLICNTYIQDLINNTNLKPLGDYIQPVDERNENDTIDNLLGISVEKKFIPSKSNKKNLNLKKYKVIRPRQFGYVTVTSRNGEKISIAILDGEPGLLSSTYVVFEVSDYKKLLPEFLFLFFQREEFDRYARFNSWGSARETFDWDEMCRVKIPVPRIEVQEAIVTIYHTLQTRKRINNQLNDMMKPLCPVLMKGVVEELEEKETEMT